MSSLGQSGGGGGTTIASETSSKENKDSLTSSKNIPGKADRSSSDCSSTSVHTQALDTDTDTTAEFESVSENNYELSTKSSDIDQVIAVTLDHVTEESSELLKKTPAKSSVLVPQVVSTFENDFCSSENIINLTKSDLSILADDLNDLHLETPKLEKKNISSVNAFRIKNFDHGFNISPQITESIEYSEVSRSEETLNISDLEEISSPTTQPIEHETPQSITNLEEISTETTLLAENSDIKTGEQISSIPDHEEISPEISQLNEKSENSYSKDNSRVVSPKTSQLANPEEVLAQSTPPVENYITTGEETINIPDLEKISSIILHQEKLECIDIDETSTEISPQTSLSAEKFEITTGEESLRIPDLEKFECVDIYTSPTEISFQIKPFEENLNITTGVESLSTTSDREEISSPITQTSEKFECVDIDTSPTEISSQISHLPEKSESFLSEETLSQIKPLEESLNITDEETVSIPDLEEISPLNTQTVEKFEYVDVDTSSTEISLQISQLDGKSESLHSEESIIPLVEHLNIVTGEETVSIPDLEEISPQTSLSTEKSEITTGEESLSIPDLEEISSQISLTTEKSEITTGEEFLSNSDLEEISSAITHSSEKIECVDINTNPTENSSQISQLAEKSESFHSEETLSLIKPLEENLNITTGEKTLSIPDLQEIPSPDTHNVEKFECLDIDVNPTEISLQISLSTEKSKIATGEESLSIPDLEESSPVAKTFKIFECLDTDTSPTDISLQISQSTEKSESFHPEEIIDIVSPETLQSIANSEETLAQFTPLVENSNILTGEKTLSVSDLKEISSSTTETVEKFECVKIEKNHTEFSSQISQFSEKLESFHSEDNHGEILSEVTQPIEKTEDIVGVNNPVDVINFEENSINLSPHIAQCTEKIAISQSTDIVETNFENSLTDIVPQIVKSVGNSEVIHCKENVENTCKIIQPTEKPLVLHSIANFEENSSEISLNTEETVGKSELLPNSEATVVQAFSNTTQCLEQPTFTNLKEKFEVTSENPSQVTQSLKKGAFLEESSSSCVKELFGDPKELPIVEKHTEFSAQIEQFIEHPEVVNFYQESEESSSNIKHPAQETELQITQPIENSEIVPEENKIPHFQSSRVIGSKSETTDRTIKSFEEKCVRTLFEDNLVKEQPLADIRNKSTTVPGSPPLENSFEKQTNKRNIEEGETDFTSFVFHEEFELEASKVSSHISMLSQEIRDSDNEEYNESDSNNHTAINGQDQLSGSNISSEFEQATNPTSTLPAADNMSAFDMFKQRMHSVLTTELNKSEAGPITADEQLSKSELFQDASNLDFEYLSSVGNNSNISDALTRQSLYVKFDPIVGKCISDTQNMPPPPPPTQASGDQPSTTPSSSKPETPKTPGRSSALDAVQTLITITPPSAKSGKSSTSGVSPAASPRAQDKESPRTRGFIAQDVLDAELQKLQDVMLKREIVFEETLTKMETEFKADIAKRDETIKEYQKKYEEAMEREAKSKKDAADKTKSKQQLSLIMEEYEKTISQLVTQREEEKREFEIQKEKIISERDLVMQHLNNSEAAFNDVHVKYERSKAIIEGMKRNEDLLKKSLTEYEDAIKKINDKYNTLKNHAVQQLETANQDSELMRRAHHAELAKLRAMLKKAEISNNSLKESLEQKTKENQELTSICDELISKVN